jgi:hypothetical protein
MRKFVFLFFTVLLFSNAIIAQDIAIGQWEEHLSYKNAQAVSEGNGKVYCASKSGVFIFNKGDNSMERLSKVNGLSDVEATVVNFNKSDNKLFIAYKNSNIDIIQNGLITNIPDIKNKSLIGNKSINNAYCLNQYAYLACGFGIVVLDMDRNEVHDTYYIGPGGASINVRDITTDGTNIYAATDAGIYVASLSCPNLADYSFWHLITGPGTGSPNGIYNVIASFKGKIYTNLSKFLMSGTLATSFIDTMYVYNGTSWSHFFQPFGYTIKSLKSFGNRLVEVEAGRIWLYDSTRLASNSSLNVVFSYFGSGVFANQAVVDNTDCLWSADANYGLVKSTITGANSFYFPNGPSSANVNDIKIADGNLWVAPGGVDNSWGGLFNTDGISSYINGNWSTVKGNYSPVVNTDTVFDILSIAINPLNKNIVYAGSWSNGLLEIVNGRPTKLYNQTNSTLTNYFGYCHVGGMAFDGSNNLWVTNSNVGKLLVQGTSGSWSALDFTHVPGVGANNIGNMIVDKNNQKWAILTRGGGILVYKGGPTDPVSTTGANAKVLTAVVGSGALPSTNVFCLAEDANGEIWVGTDQGIAVFYSPENIFSGGNYDAQQILLEQDGHVQILLLTELVQAIAVDDDNRKWIATANSGVFLMSADGTQQIYHFDVDNSPLFSNNVNSIAINHATGEVYFGTAKGIISYRGTSTQGLDDFTNVYAFPNPVKHDYNGPIAIKGLVSNSILKITDITGKLVYSVQSEGGQAIWYGTNFNGDRVSTGVYMVFCSSQDGTKKAVTKILVIN